MFQNAKAGLIGTVRRDPLYLALVLFSLYPVYNQVERVSDSFIGGTVTGLLFTILFLSQPPMMKWMKQRRLWLVSCFIQSFKFLYWLAIIILIIAYARCVLIPFYFIGLPLLALAIIPRVFKIISYKHYILTVFDLFLLLTLLLFNAKFWDAILSHIENPLYLRKVIASSETKLSCLGNNYDVEHPPLWMRRIHLYESDSIITATNGYEFLSERDNNVAGVVAKRTEEGCRLRWFYGSFCRDMIYDGTRSVYFASHFFDKEIVALNENMNVVNRKRLNNEIVELALFTNRKGEKRLLALSFLDGKLYFLDPYTLDIISSRVYSPFIANCNFVRISQTKRRLYCSVISWGYIATIINLEDMDQVRRGVWGLGSWGIDYEPDSNYFYISDFFLGRLYKVDEETMKIVDQSLLRPGIRSVVFDPNRRYIYVGDYYLKDVFVLDENLNEIGRLRSNGRITDMALSHDGGLLYTIGWKGVYTIDLNSALDAQLPGTV